MSSEDALLARWEHRGHGTIYVITNLVTGHQYIGATMSSLEKRWEWHKKEMNAASPLHEAMKLYTVAAFKIEPVITCLNMNDLGTLEQEIIKQRRPFYNRNQDVTVWKKVDGKIVVENRPASKESETHEAPPSLFLDIIASSKRRGKRPNRPLSGREVLRPINR